MAITAELIGKLGGHSYYGGRDLLFEGVRDTWTTVPMTDHYGVDVLPPGEYMVLLIVTRGSSFAVRLRFMGQEHSIVATGPQIMVRAPLTITTRTTPLLEVWGAPVAAGARQVRDITIAIIPTT